MRLLILLLVAVGAAVSSTIKFVGHSRLSPCEVSVANQEAASVSYQQILAISKTVCKRNESQFSKLVPKAKGNADSMMKNWYFINLYIQHAKFAGNDHIVMSGEFWCNDKLITGRFDFEKRKNDWVLTDFPPILLSTPTNGTLNSTIKFDGNARLSPCEVSVANEEVVSVAYQQILAISKTVCKRDDSKFIKLVPKAEGDAESMMDNWYFLNLYIQFAKLNGDDHIVMSGEFTFNDKRITGKFVFEKKTNDWVLTDFPLILLSTPPKG